MNVEAPANCTCFNLRKAVRAVTQMYDEALKPSGLRTTQFSLLSVVGRKGPIGISELAQALGMDRTTLTRNLKPLTDKGLVDVSSGTDRRQRPVALTSAGEDALAQALPLWRGVQSRMVGGLGHDRWRGLLGDLNAAARQAQAG